MINCRRRQATEPQKLKKLSMVVFRFLLAEVEVIGVEAEAVEK